MPKLSEVEYSYNIVIKGARENNLKNISVEIPRNKLTVITGLSGSGKSTLAFETLYAEGQRRYIESLSSYARGFMESLAKPNVDSIQGLSPSIAIDQKTIATNPRSTVGTITEIYDYLRLLYARVATPHCPTHKVAVSSSKPDQIVDEILKLPKGSKFIIFSPMAQSEKGEFLNLFQKWLKRGFTQVRINGQWTELEKAKKLEKHKRHDIDLLIDRLIIDEKYLPRLKESVHRALTTSQGLVGVEVVSTLASASVSVSHEPYKKIFSIHRACPVCSFSFPEAEPRLFSFNNPRGACETCSGMGIIGFIEDTRESTAEEEDEELYRSSEKICPDCQGLRLKKSSLSFLLDQKNIAELSTLSAEELNEFFSHLKLPSKEQLVAKKIIEQIQARLSYLLRVGAGYLSLDRQTRTLSGGEVQRIRLATQVGSALVGVLYILDEPSIGLHSRDHHRLLEILKELRDRGNTVVLVEHDVDTIRAADYVIDIGPGAGVLGGQVMAYGTPQDIEKNKMSLTGQYLSGQKKIPKPLQRRVSQKASIEILGARGNNLKNVNLKIPLGILCGVTGVSGSGKSTLIIDTLYKALAQKLNKSQVQPAPFDKISGIENIERVVQINQKPIGRTPRSTPATYVGLFSELRDLYSQLPESKIRGYTPGHFSFNVKGGRCERCEGAGVVRVEMHFLADVFVLCDLCQGLRYNSEIRSLRFKDKSIADVLKMTVAEALDFFKNHPLIYRKIETLYKVGLDYIALGQSSTTLSGGEAQRIKLSKELSKKGTGKTLYILDEPTTGLHFEDVRKLIELLQALVQQGNTVLVIEHNLDVVKCCDYIIDVGPDGGRYGGQIVAQGSPEKIILSSQSETARYLKPYLV